MVPHSYRFDLATATTIDGDVATVELDGQWNVNGTILNGGYLKAVAVSAARTVLDAQSDPVAVSTTYIAPPVAGPALVQVTPLRRGRSVSTGLATMTQAGAVILQALVTLGDLAEGSVAAPLLPRPEVPTPAECLSRIDHELAGGPGLAQVVETAIVPGFDGWFRGVPSTEARQRAWIRFRDGRPLDTLGVIALADMLPPVGFALGNFGWAPTLQLQVGIFAQPGGNWLLVDLLGNPYAGVFVCEDADMWDETGQLVARARQVAMLPKAR